MKTAFVSLVALLLAGCGLPVQQVAEPLPTAALGLPAPSLAPSPSSPATEPSPTTPLASPSPAGETLRLWYVQEDGLASSRSALIKGASPQDILTELTYAPSSSPELRTLLADPVSPDPVAWVPQDAAIIPGLPVPVALSPVVISLPPAEQLLLLGQIVLSLTGAGYSQVSFVDGSGTVLAVPAPDGRLIDFPAAARDYSGLIVRP